MTLNNLPTSCEQMARWQRWMMRQRQDCNYNIHLVLLRKQRNKRATYLAELLNRTRKIRSRWTTGPRHQADRSFLISSQSPLPPLLRYCAWIEMLSYRHPPLRNKLVHRVKLTLYLTWPTAKQHRVTVWLQLKSEYSIIVSSIYFAPLDPSHFPKILHRSIAIKPWP